MDGNGPSPPVARRNRSKILASTMLGQCESGSRGKCWLPTARPWVSLHTMRTFIGDGASCLGRTPQYDRLMLRSISRRPELGSAWRTDSSTAPRGDPVDQLSLRYLPQKAAKRSQARQPGPRSRATLWAARPVVVVAGGQPGEYPARHVVPLNDAVAAAIEF